MKCTFKCTIQCSWACSPYLCAQSFNWSLSIYHISPLMPSSPPITCIFISLPLCVVFSLILVHYLSPLSLVSLFHLYLYFSSPLSSMTTKTYNIDSTTCKDLIGNENHLVISFHHSIVQLTFITQAWMFKFNTCAMQANIWNAHTNTPYKFMSLLPLLVCSKF